MPLTHELDGALSGALDNQPERKLWGAVVAALIEDAQAYWLQKAHRGAGPNSVTMERAFDDVCKVGPMMRRCCGMCGLDPHWLSEGFIRWCESMA
ncbi:hypothetical protein ASQ50_00870 [Marinobacter sp. LQ44]|nr:hypothetical protein ASQ50_00870 [Marinobacter sp. LQ44]